MSGFCAAAFKESGKSETSNTVLTAIDSLTGHSGRVTILCLLVYENTDYFPLMLQGHWRSPNTPVKYVREKNKLAAIHVSDSATVLRRQWRALDEDSQGFSSMSSESEGEIGTEPHEVPHFEGVSFWATRKAVDSRHAARVVVHLQREPCVFQLPCSSQEVRSP